jgi:hypothetical protein
LNKSSSTGGRQLSRMTRRAATSSGSCSSTCKRNRNTARRSPTFGCSVTCRPTFGRAINLPQLDEGIDLIARERHGGYWAIQAKFLTANDKRLSRRLLGTFTALASDTCSNIGLQVIAHTSAKRVGKLDVPLGRVRNRTLRDFAMQHLISFRM